jgi:hypothetical protein
MKARRLTVAIIFFLSFSAFFLTNANAGVFDTVNFINLNYNLQYTQSDVYSASNMITHGNQIEVVYASSRGIKNLVLTNTSGGFSPQIYSVSSDVISSYENGYSLIQNSSDLHLFYCNGTNIKHYYAPIGNHIWSLVENLGVCVHGTVSYIFDKNDQSTIYGAYTRNFLTLPTKINITYCEKTSSWNCDNGKLYGSGSYTFYLSQSLQTSNRFLTYHNGFVTSGRGDRNLDDISTISSRNVGDLDLAYNYRYIRGSATGFSEINAEYYATMHCNDSFGIICNGAFPILYELDYVFSTSDSLGINCTLTAGSSVYWCGGIIPYSSTTFSIQSYPNAYIHVPMKLDNLGNLHLLYSANDNALVHFFQNNSKSSWGFDKIINITEEDRLRDFVIYENGIMVMQTGESSTNLNFWYNGASLLFIGVGTTPPIPPSPTDIPPAISDSSFMGLICNGGVWLTGTTYEGGCLVSSLFILAIFLSVVGWIFKYIEIEYYENEHKIQDKYLVSGLISLGLIITFAVIGIADLVTAILGFFMITAVLIAYYERGREKQ